MDVRIHLDEADVAALRTRTGIENAREAVVDWIRRAKAPESRENAGERAHAAFEALRADARKKHPNGMTQAQIRALIAKVRRAREETSDRH